MPKPPQQKPTPEDYEAARLALRDSRVIGRIQAEWHHRAIVDLVWPIAYAAGWRAREERIEEARGGDPRE